MVGMKLNPITSGVRTGIVACASFVFGTLVVAPFLREPREAVTNAVGFTIGGVLFLAWALFRRQPPSPTAR